MLTADELREIDERKAANMDTPRLLAHIQEQMQRITELDAFRERVFATVAFDKCGEASDDFLMNRILDGDIPEALIEHERERCATIVHQMASDPLFCRKPIRALREAERRIRLPQEVHNGR